MGTGGGLVVIDFSAQGNSAHFRRAGWSGQEPDRVWAIGSRSVLVVPMQSSGRTVTLEAELAPGAPSAIAEGQIVRVRVNGNAIGSVVIRGRAMIRCEIDPAFSGGDGLLEIEFQFPGYHRPDWLGFSRDDRVLSCWFSFVRIYTRDMYKPGPWFPASHPDIPVVELMPPFADATKPPGAPAAAVRFDWTADPDASGPCAQSQMKLPAPSAPGAYALRIDMQPPEPFAAARARQITVLLDRIVVTQFSFTGSTTQLAPLPRELTEGRETLALNFVARDPDAGLADHSSAIAVGQLSLLGLPRSLPVADKMRQAQNNGATLQGVSAEFLTEDAMALPTAIEAALGVAPAALMRRFESLGTNPGFGVMQQKLGSSAINLFRFADCTVPDLLRVLSDGPDPNDAIVTHHGADPSERSPTYRLQWPATADAPSGAGDAMSCDHAQALRYMRRKFFQGLNGGRKIYVLNDRRPIPVGLALAVLLELNRYGGNALLWVEPASPGHRPGEVELLLPGLMRGYVSQPSPDGVVDTAEPTDWLRLMANATVLHNPASVGGNS